MKAVLIIEDDQSIADLQRDYLEAEGFRCVLASDGNTGIGLARQESYDCIILDLMLPGLDGFAICRTLREESDIPIIIVSARKDDINKIRGLGLGADDFVTKPFSPAELTARVKAHIARYERLRGNQARGSIFSVRGLTLDSDRHSVHKDGTLINLTVKEFELLALLMANPGRVFTKEDIFSAIWNDRFGDISTVTVHVRRLREKIEADPSKPVYIETVWGVGYSLKLRD